MDSILVDAAAKWIAEGVPDTWLCTHLAEADLRGLFFESVPFKGKPTRVFAWIGLPAGASAQQPVPGVVLIHGGGGTAFARWVRWWQARGFAAIALDCCGAMPLPDTGILGSADWPRHNWSGPRGGGSFDQADWPLQDQWIYHACAGVTKAHSLLASLPEVDENRIGVTGVSWGGFLTCLAAGIDARYRCAAPVYGCGFVSEESIWTADGSFDRLTERQQQVWRTNWDPAVVLPRARQPMLWLNGTNDFAYWPPIWQRSANAAAGPRQMCMKVRWPHGHIPAAEEVSEIERFFRAHLMGFPPMTSISPPIATGNLLTAAYASSRPLRTASLVLTVDKGPWPDRQWHLFPAEIDSDRQTVQAVIPEHTQAAYFSLISDEWLYTTSDLVFYNVTLES